MTCTNMPIKTIIFSSDLLMAFKVEQKPFDLTELQKLIDDITIAFRGSSVDPKIWIIYRQRSLHY